MFLANSIPEPLTSPNPKPELAALRPPSRDEPTPGGYLPPRGLPDKSPVNGTDPAPPKTLPTPAPTSYNRYVPKPYTSSARPFERKFESPKFNHNLLPNDTQVKTDLLIKPSVVSNSGGKPQLSPQPLDHDSGLDTFTRTMDNRPKYQHNNINAIPKAIPVRYIAHQFSAASSLRIIPELRKDRKGLVCSQGICFCVLCCAFILCQHCFD